MSDVRNKANNLDASFPIPGANNSSQGFRNNTAATQQALFQASDELDKIQRTRFTYTGDGSGTSDQIGNAVVVGNGDPTLTINFTLGNTIGAQTTFGTNDGDFTLTFDPKGRLASYTRVQHQINWATGHNRDAFVPITGNDLGTGTGAIVFPVFKYDGNGRLTGSSTQTFNFGLLSHTMTSGALLVGRDNKSAELAAPNGSGAYSLVSNNGVLSWQAVSTGTVSGVIGGTGIQVTADPSAPVVNLDLNNLPADVDIVAGDFIPWVDVSAATQKKIPFAQFQNKIIKLSIDTQPTLGGILDTSFFPISSTDVQGVKIQSAPSIPKTSISVKEDGITLLGSSGAPLTLQAPSLTLNGQSWPTAAPTTGQFLTAAANGTLVWTTPAITTFPALQNTYFVSNNGDDTSGNGSIVTPFKTISHALGLIPKLNQSLYTIVLMGGSYDENLTIENISNLSLEGMFSTANAKITGKTVFSYNLDKIRVSKIDFDNSQNTDAQPVVAVIAGANDLMFQNVNVLAATPQNAAMDLTGQIIKNVDFYNGEIRGTINSAFESDEGYTFVRRGWDYKQDKYLKIQAVTEERALSANDAGTYIRVNQSVDNSLSVPDFATTPIPIGSVIHLSQLGTGRTSIVPSGNVTINTPDGYTLRKRFSKAMLIHVAQDTWDLSGDLDETITVAPTVRADTDTITADSALVTADNG